MTAFQLAGVALAALLSENFILVNCLGIGTRTKAFQDPLDAWRTGVSLTAVMTLTALLSWLLDQLLQHFALGYFQTLVFALVGPAVVAGLRYFLKNCVPELSRRMDENLASITSNCAAMGAALLIAQRGYGSEPHQLPQEFPGHPHRTCDCRPDGPVPGGLLRPAPVLNHYVSFLSCR